MKATPMGWLFGIATLTASALLFAVQPMIGKMLLPYFGGTPGVWNTCMLFFQAMLLAGYGYAHLTTARLGFRGQVALHGTLAAAALLVLPITVPVDRLASDFGAFGPAPRLFGLLVASAGAAVLPDRGDGALAATLVHVQRRPPGPRPVFPVRGEQHGQPAGPGGLSALDRTALDTRKSEPRLGVGLRGLGRIDDRLRGRRLGAGARRHPAPVDSVEDADPIGWSTWLDWIVLAALPSSWLLAVTTYATTDLASMPLLWTIPLGIYLATYILAFGASGTWWKRGAEAVFPWLAAALALVLSAGFVHAFWIPLHALAFFFGALLVPPAARRIAADGRSPDVCSTWRSLLAACLAACSTR